MGVDWPIAVIECGRSTSGVAENIKRSVIVTIKPTTTTRRIRPIEIRIAPEKKLNFYHEDV